MSFINFESSWEKDKQRQWEREAREAVIEKAKKEYETKQLKEKEARQRGEHVWMLPSVESKLHSDKHHKKKKKKKEKKKKKLKREKKDDSSSSGSEDKEEGVWLEKSSCGAEASKKMTAAEPTTSEVKVKVEDSSEVQIKRDEWMEMTSLFGTYSRDEIRERDGTSRKKIKEEEKKRKQEAEKPGSHARELNPFFRDGGTGLPEEKRKDPSFSPGLDAAWLRKALKRAIEQAKLEGKSLEEIATQRWGSLEKFHELLAEAEGKGKKKQEDQQRRWSRERSRSKGRDRSKSRERRRDSNRHSEDGSWKYGKKTEKGKTREERSNWKKEKNQRRRCSSSESSTSSGGRSQDVRGEIDRRQKHKSHRSAQGTLRSSDDSQPSCLSLKFQRPGDGYNERSTRNPDPGSLPSSNRRWKKKEYKQEVMDNEIPQHKSASPSSSSSESSGSEEECAEAKILVPQKDALSLSESTSQPPTVLLTDREMNELAAKIMKAELLGNDSQASKLKVKLEAARAALANSAASSKDKEEIDSQTTEEVVVLTRMDRKGTCRPVSGSDPKVKGERKRKKTKTHDKDGIRTRYFPDDDRHDLKSMFEREKGTSAEDQNSMFERAAMQNVEKLNDDYDVDDMFMSKAVLKETHAKQTERDRLKAIQEHRRSERSLESCSWCLDNKKMEKHLIVALGTKSYVCLPNHESLTPGHCFIIPIHHISCSVQADEDLWSEIQTFRKSLVKMFNSRGEDCVFFETVKNLRNHPHMAITCVPLPREMGDLAPIYFKKAIMECEGEWALNKKLVDLKNRDVRRAVPKGLPYFFVDFAMEAGFAHVIEDENHFPQKFAQEIIGGMLDLDINLWRRPHKENFDSNRRKSINFSRWYKDFDPTQDD